MAASNPTRGVSGSAPGQQRPPPLAPRAALDLASALGALMQYGADWSREQILWRRRVSGVATDDDNPRHPDPWDFCGGRRRWCCCNRSRPTTPFSMSRPGCGCCWCPGTPGSAAPFTDSGPLTRTTTIHWNSTSKVNNFFHSFPPIFAHWFFARIPLVQDNIGHKSWTFLAHLSFKYNQRLIFYSVVSATFARLLLWNCLMFVYCNVLISMFKSINNL